MAVGEGNYLKNISVGITVKISPKINRNALIEGVVSEILTHSAEHPYGIMVKLSDGTIGRVKEILSSNSKAILPEVINTIQPVDPLSVDREPLQESITIKENDSGYSYKNLFYPYIKNAKIIIITDAYIRNEYQIKNLVFFCSIILERQEPLKLHLVTSSDNEYSQHEQTRKLNELKDHLVQSNIIFTYEFNNNLHDRSITTDNGWKIIPGRGLDIFKDPGSYYSPSNFDQTKKKCKQTEIHYIKVNNK